MHSHYGTVAQALVAESRRSWRKPVLRLVGQCIDGKHWHRHSDVQSLKTLLPKVRVVIKTMTLRKKNECYYQMVGVAGGPQTIVRIRSAKIILALLFSGNRQSE